MKARVRAVTARRGVVRAVLVRAVLAGAVVVGVGGLGGCSSDPDGAGGPDGSTAGSVLAPVTALGESLDRPAYVGAAATLCSDGDMGAVGEPVGASSTEEEIDSYRDAVETRLDLLQQLPVPAGDEATVDELVAGYDRVVLALDELGTAVADGDGQAAVLVAAALDGLRAEVADLASAYGIDACGL